jgi:hypothetical protein
LTLARASQPANAARVRGHSSELVWVDRPQRSIVSLIGQPTVLSVCRPFVRYSAIEFHREVKQLGRSLVRVLTPVTAMLYYSTPREELCSLQLETGLIA